MENIFVAEMIGTMILILLGNGVVAAVLLTKSKAYDSGWLVIATGWGFAVAIAVYVSGQFSGGHINPAVTLAMVTNGSIGWDVVPQYIGGQFAGAFIGATLVWLAYLAHWEVTEDKGAKLAAFSTAPAIRKPVHNIITEAIGTAMLVIGVLAIVSTLDGATEGLGHGMGPLLIGVLVWSIGLSLGGPTGYAINPARDLGPRIMHAILPIAGKGGSDWAYSWIPVVGPIIGGVSGALIWMGLT